MVTEVIDNQIYKLAKNLPVTDSDIIKTRDEVIEYTKKNPNTNISTNEIDRILLANLSESIYNECIDIDRYDRLMSYIRNTCENILRHNSINKEDELDDLTAITIMQIYRSINNVNHPKAFLGFIKMTILRNIFLLSKEQKLRNITSIDAEDNQLNIVITDNYSTKSDLIQAISQSEELTERDKHILFLLLEEFSINEIARKLSMTIAAVATIKNRLRNKIKRDKILWELLGYNT